MVPSAEPPGTSASGASERRVTEETSAAEPVVGAASVAPETGAVKHRSLLSDATLGTLGAIGATVISGVASIMIARELGVVARGRWAVVSSTAVVVAAIAGTGLPTAAAYGAARLNSPERERFVRASITGGLVMSLVGAVVYLAASAAIHPPVTAVTVIVGCSIPAALVFYQTLHALILVVSTMRWFALVQVITAVATLIAVLVASVLGQLSVLDVVAISAGSSTVGCGVGLVALKRTAGSPTRILIAPVQAARLLRPYVAYATLTFITLSLTQIVQRVDVLLVSGYKGSRAAGLYAVAVQVTDLMLVVPGALGLVIFRRTAKSAPNHYGSMLVMLRWTGAFGVAAAAVALAAAGWVVPLVFGASYRGSVEPLRLLLPGVIAFALLTVLSQYLAGRGRPRAVVVAWLIGAVIGVGADLVVIPAFGIAGAAVVSSAAYLIVMALHVRALRDLRRRDG
jgi:O-antigen/teichoic acid export membrane protein